MHIIPAIDIINGECVRLTQGDYSTRKVYASNPVDVARHLEESGFKRLHLVDLDGAKCGKSANQHILRQISEATSLTIDYGGGVKSRQDIESVLENGASYIDIGSLAVQQPETFNEYIKVFGAERFILCADAKNGLISINGWTESSLVKVTDFLKHYYTLGIRNILCTDISRDGMLNGPSVELYKQIMQEYPESNLIASGGVSSIEDVRLLSESGVPSVVIGKAIYENLIKLEDLCSLNE